MRRVAVMQTPRTAAEKQNASSRNREVAPAKSNSSCHESQAAAWTGTHVPTESNSAEAGGPGSDSFQSSVQQLQRTIGNQGVQRLLQRKAMTPMNDSIAIIGQPQE